MTDPWIWGLIASLILLAIGTTLKSAHDAFLLKKSDKEVTRLLSEIETLKKNHDQALSSIGKSNSAEIEKLNKQVASASNKTHDYRIEEIREKFLQLLAIHPGITSLQIANPLGKSAEFVTYHLTEMENEKLVHGSYSTVDDTEWSIAQGGRAYLAKHGLLS